MLYQNMCSDIICIKHMCADILIIKPLEYSLFEIIDLNIIYIINRIHGSLEI